MNAEDPGWSRSEWARWFLDHDEVDEAASVLEPGDELELSAADHRDLAAALARRGLQALQDNRRTFVQARAAASTDAGLEALARDDRRPPGRTTPLPAAPIARKQA